MHFANHSLTWGWDHTEKAAQKGAEKQLLAAGVDISSWAGRWKLPLGHKPPKQRLCHLPAQPRKEFLPGEVMMGRTWADSTSLRWCTMNGTTLKQLGFLCGFEDVSVLLVEDLSPLLRLATGGCAPWHKKLLQTCSSTSCFFRVSLNLKGETACWARSWQWFHCLFTSGIDPIWCLAKQMEKKFFSEFINIFLKSSNDEALLKKSNYSISEWNAHYYDFPISFLNCRNTLKENT